MELAVKALVSRGWPVHRSRVITYLACAALTALSLVAAVLPAGPALLATLLLVAAGALGLFPIYYSLTQELSARHQGKLTGALGCIAYECLTGRTVWSKIYTDEESVDGKEVPDVVHTLDQNLGRGLSQIVSGLDQYFSGEAAKR